jgi:O-antigen/teichoic acid export membrane protein
MNQDKSSSLIKGFSWSLASNLVTVVCQTGFLLVLTRIGDTHMTGEYGFANALVVPILSLSNLQLRGLQSTDGRNEFIFSDYLGLRVCTVAVALPFVWANILWNSQNEVVGIAAAVIAVRLTILSFSDVFYGLFQQHEWMATIAKANVFTNIGSLIAFSAALWLTGSLVAAVCASTLITIPPLIFHNLPMAIRLAATPSVGGALKPTFQRQRLISLFRMALPLGIVSFLISLNANVPRYFLADDENMRNLGIFFGLVSLFVAADQFASALAQVISPRLAKLFARGQKAQFIKLLVRIEAVALLFGIAGVLIIVFAGPNIVGFIYSPEYAEYPDAMIFLALSAAAALMSRFIGNAITVGRKLKSQVITNVLCVAVLTGACFYLIPAHGVSGASAAVFASSLIRLLSNGAILLKFLGSWTPVVRSLPKEVLIS